MPPSRLVDLSVTVQTKRRPLLMYLCKRYIILEQRIKSAKSTSMPPLIVISHFGFPVEINIVFLVLGTVSLSRSEK